MRKKKKTDEANIAEWSKWVTLGDGDWVFTSAWILRMWSRDLQQPHHRDAG